MTRCLCLVTTYRQTAANTACALQKISNANNELDLMAPNIHERATGASAVATPRGRRPGRRRGTIAGRQTGRVREPAPTWLAPSYTPLWRRALVTEDSDAVEIFLDDGSTTVNAKYKNINQQNNRMWR